VKGFARREFQLMLLRRMADFQPDLVEAAHTELGASHAQYLAAHNRWQTMLHSARAPRGLTLYRAVLGPPDTERAVPFGEVELTEYTWRLPGLWPDLVWRTIVSRVAVGLHEVVLDGALVRPEGAEVPALPPPESLAPWSCVVGDVVMRFPAARQVDPDVPSQWLIELDGRQLWFVHGLLQAVRPAWT
jgi:hypothetical protein